MLLIFDFDGTICNSLDKAIEIVNKFLKENSLDLITKNEIRNLGVISLIQSRKINIIKIPELVLMGRKEIAKFIPYMQVFPGLKVVIKKLSQKHILTIISSNSRVNVKKFLIRNGLDNCFKDIDDELDLFGKERKILKLMKKYKFEQDETVYIGDETRDVEAAKKAKIRSIVVTWGYESKKLLIKAKPNIIISSPNQLLKL